MAELETLVADANNSYGVHPDLWRWDPDVSGHSFTRFLDKSKLPDSAKEGLRAFTPRVLGQSVRPTENGRATGLVIGKVQSGKTNSFLALSALASDNGFRVVILLSGTKNVLKNQTHRQAVNELSRGVRGWKMLDFDPSVSEATLSQRLRLALSSIESRTLVITLLKRTRAGQTGTDSQGIDRLASLISESDYAADLRRTPVIIVDDEADEAGLDNSANARRAGRVARPSATSLAIGRLRDLFDRHFFVQYTATPQANLLVELSSQLSPDFCELLDPGEGYCGAQEFFPPEEDHYVEIPQADVLAVGTGSNAPPATLVDAIRYFFVASAVEDFRAEDEQTPQVRSMLVHPERTVASHRTALKWVTRIRQQFLDALDDAAANPNGPSARGLTGLIQKQLDELARTCETGDLNPADLLGHLHSRVEDCEVKLVNSEAQLGEALDWDEWASWIFVGGDVLSRGFAMNGLTTTWMPRSAGGGQIDVLLQRGRFFGYRRDFFEYCRVFLPRDVLDDYYALFADHERSLWASLREHLDRGKGLADWSRVFWMDSSSPGLRLCRRSTQWFRLRQQEPWAQQLWYPRADAAADVVAASHNAGILDAFTQQLDWQPAHRPAGSREIQHHDGATVPLADLAAALEEYRFFDDNTADLAVIRDAVWVLLEANPRATATVARMRPNASSVRGQSSARGALNRIASLQAGRSGRWIPTDPRFYPGDSAYRAGRLNLPGVENETLTLQIHRPALRDQNGAVLTDASGYLRGGCPLLSVHLPEAVLHYRRETAGDRRPA